jgi:CRISPR type III-A-associated RAMP protein Csm5
MSKTYKATIEVVTPVHIGVFDFDYFSFFQKEGYLYVIDWVKVFREKTLFDKLKLILDKKFDNEEEWFNYYKNEFIERYKEEIVKNNLITERIKINKGLNKEITSFHRNLKFHIRYFDFEKERYIPYLPGSSIKGVLGEIFQLSKEDAEKLLVSDFYQENEEERTEIMEAQRYYLNFLNTKKGRFRKSVYNFVEVFTPKTKFFGQVKINDKNLLSDNFYSINKKIKNYNYKYFNLLSKHLKDFIENLKNNQIILLLGFGVGENFAKTKYLVDYNGEKLPLGLTVLTLD